MWLLRKVRQRNKHRCRIKLIEETKFKINYSKNMETLELLTQNMVVLLAEKEDT